MKKSSVIVLLLVIVIIMLCFITIKVSFKPEDVNRYGKVTAQDYVLIKNYIMNEKETYIDNYAREDVNKDGKIDALDLLIVQKRIIHDMEEGDDE